LRSAEHTLLANVQHSMQHEARVCVPAGQPAPGADVAESRRRCGRVPAQMWPSPGADVTTRLRARGVGAQHGEVDGPEARGDELRVCRRHRRLGQLEPEVAMWVARRTSWRRVGCTLATCRARHATRNMYHTACNHGTAAPSTVQIRLRRAHLSPMQSMAGESHQQAARHASCAADATGGRKATRRRQPAPTRTHHCTAQHAACTRQTAILRNCTPQCPSCTETTTSTEEDVARSCVPWCSNFATQHKTLHRRRTF
jgi:hypothetical protein